MCDSNPHRLMQPQNRAALHGRCLRSTGSRDGIDGITEGLLFGMN